MDAEGAFRDAQMAVAKIDAGDMNELALKACLSGIYDMVRMRSGVAAWPRVRRRPSGFWACSGRSRRANGLPHLCSAWMSTVGSKVARSRSSIAGGGRSERLAEIAAEFVRLKVGVIVTAGTAAVSRKAKATVSLIWSKRSWPELFA